MGKFKEWRVRRSGLPEDEFDQRRKARWEKAKKILKPVVEFITLFIPNASVAVDVGKELSDKIEDRNKSKDTE